MDNSLYHLVREPKIKLHKNPLLLLLHGYGSNEEDLFAFAPELPGEYFVISVRAPYQLPPYGYAWYAIDFNADETKFSDYDQARKSRDKIIEFIEHLPTKYSIDENDITLIGFSQGSILSYAVALSHPQKIKRVVAMSGYLSENILAEGYENNDFSAIKFFVSHGTVDQVVPVDWERNKSIPVLKKLNINHVYKEYPIGHGVSPQNFHDVVAFLKSK
jgi:phospholipase/carboxylesterase